MTKKLDPRLQANASCLRWTLVITPGEVRRYTSGNVTLSASEMRSASSGEIKILQSFETFSDLKADVIKGYAEKYEADYSGLKKLTPIDVALVAWHRMCELSVPATGNVFSEGPKVRNGGKPNSTKGSKRLDRVYRRTKLTDSEIATRKNIALCPQARACLKIFMDAGVDEVPEAEMLRLMEANQESLNTRQGPWRIWQYYRPQLIAARWLTLN